VEPLSIIKDFNVVKEGGLCLEVVGEILVLDQFGFERAPEGFPGGIVVAVAGGAPAQDDLPAMQQLLEGAAGILESSIRMVEEPGGGPAHPEGLAQGFFHQRTLQSITKGPADDFTAVEIHDCGQINPAALGLQIGDVGAIAG
jgi:hypothetical protein